MYNNVTIIEEFRTLAGLRQNDNPAFQAIASDLLYDGTNVLIQHPLLNIENIDMAARNYAMFDFPAYAPATPYAVGARVKYSNLVYQSKVAANTGNQPDTSPAEWELINLLSLYLEDVFRNAAEDTVNQVFNQKRLNGQTKTLLKSLRFYAGTGSLSNTVLNEGDFVGVMVKLTYKNNMLAVIEQIGLQLTAPNNPLRIYLFHDSQIEPLATLDINHTKTISFQWHELGFKLHSIAQEHDAGGTFFIMYDQAQLVGQAVQKTYDFHVAPCNYCDVSVYDSFILYSKYIYMQAVRVKAADRNGTNLWDIRKTQMVAGNNFGLNFQLTVKCDLTDFLVQQKGVFQYAFRDMVTQKLLEGISNSTRQNGAQEKAANMARNELMGTFAGGMGFQKKVEKQIEAVDFEVSALDDLCMPCNKKGGLSYGTAALSRGR